jgi:predicted transcriptional regulator
MTSPVVTVTPDHTIDDCMRIITAHRIRHLPVMSGDDLVGMISIGDLVKSIISAQAHTIDQLSGYIEGRYPA